MRVSAKLGPMKALLAQPVAILLLALAASCASQVDGDAGHVRGTGGEGGSTPVSSAGGAPSSSTTQAPEQDVVCGADEGGPKCTLGSACAPDRFPDSCLLDATLHCQAYDRADCSELPRARCEEGGTFDCGTTGAPLACSCRGTVMTSDCAEAFYGIAPDPEFCNDGGTFSCGATECRKWLDVCVQSTNERPSGECMEADEVGCTQYGVAECACIDVGPGQQCDDSVPESVRLLN